MVPFVSPQLSMSSITVSKFFGTKKILKLILVFFFFIFCFGNNMSALYRVFVAWQLCVVSGTFSIVGVDMETKEVGSAGASCIDVRDYGWVDVIAGIIPGVGAVNAQAASQNDIFA